MKSSSHHILLREQVVRATRQFFVNDDFHEIIPPILNSAIPNEPNLHPFVTEWDQSTKRQKLYLPTSPERSLKLALATGIGNCFAIGHSFRNLEGSGSLHSPEFLMLEWYRVNSDYQDIMNDVKDYVMHIHNMFIGEQTKTPHLIEEWSTISIKDIFENELNINYEDVLTDDRVIFEHTSRLGYNTQGATWRQLFDQIMVNEIESKLSRDPVFLVDFPSRISPLCAVNQESPHVSERFELYINRVEIANGNNENLDVESIRNTFNTESKVTGLPVDVEFLEAIGSMRDSGNYFAGVGLGIERLMMVLREKNSISPIE